MEKAKEIPKYAESSFCMEPLLRFRSLGPAKEPADLAVEKLFDSDLKIYDLIRSAASSMGHSCCKRTYRGKQVQHTVEEDHCT